MNWGSQGGRDEFFMRGTGKEDKLLPSRAPGGQKPWMSLQVLSRISKRAEDMSNNQHTFPVVFARAGCQIPPLALSQAAHLHWVKDSHEGEGKEGDKGR